MYILILHTDIDCKVYIDTEYYGTTSANADCEFVLGVGAYWVEVVAEDYSEISESVIEKMIDGTYDPLSEEI